MTSPIAAVESDSPVERTPSTLNAPPVDASALTVSAYPIDPVATSSTRMSTAIVAFSDPPENPPNVDALADIPNSVMAPVRM